MKIKLLSLFILLNYLSAFSCSFYKITKFGKTYVGNNVDNWDSNTRIWFEKGNTTEYGTMFFGFENLYDYAAQVHQAYYNCRVRSAQDFCEYFTGAEFRSYLGQLQKLSIN